GSPIPETDTPSIPIAQSLPQPIIRARRRRLSLKHWTIAINIAFFINLLTVHLTIAFAQSETPRNWMLVTVGFSLLVALIIPIILFITSFIGAIIATILNTVYITRIIDYSLPKYLIRG